MKNKPRNTKMFIDDIHRAHPHHLEETNTPHSRGYMSCPDYITVFQCDPAVYWFLLILFLLYCSLLLVNFIVCKRIIIHLLSDFERQEVLSSQKRTGTILNNDKGTLLRRVWCSNIQYIDSISATRMICDTVLFLESVMFVYMWFYPFRPLSAWNVDGLLWL